MKLKFHLCLITTAICALAPAALHAQNTDKLTETEINKADSLFWQAYNTCDLALMSNLITPDLEFYHDKGGITLGRDSLIAGIKKGMCGDAFRLRRIGIDSTIKVYLLKKNQITYGAIISGEHNFYLTPAGKPEFLDGHALFSNLWLLRDGKWLMARVFSYDHGPAKYVNKRVVVKLSAKALQKYTGTYKGPQSGNMVVSASGDHLTVTIGQKTFAIYPQSETSYFMKERDLTFDLVTEAGNKRKLIVKELGNVVEEAAFLK